MALRPQPRNTLKSWPSSPTERRTHRRWAITPEHHPNTPETKESAILSRTRKTAKQAGAKFEKLVADFLAENLDDRIERRVLGGAKDRGDIANVRDSHNRRIVIEAKDYGGRLQPAQWLREAHQEALNDNAYAGIVIAKRKGTTNPADQYVLTDLATLTRLLKGPGQ